MAYISHIWVLLPSADAADAIASWWERERQSYIIVSAELKLPNRQKPFLVHRIQTKFVFSIPRYRAVLCGIDKKHVCLNDKRFESAKSLVWKCAASTKPDSLLREHWRDFIQMESDCEAAGTN